MMKICGKCDALWGFRSVGDLRFLLAKARSVARLCLARALRSEWQGVARFIIGWNVRVSFFEILSLRATHSVPEWQEGGLIVGDSSSLHFSEWQGAPQANRGQGNHFLVGFQRWKTFGGVRGEALYNCSDSYKQNVVLRSQSRPNGIRFLTANFV